MLYVFVFVYMNICVFSLDIYHLKAGDMKIGIECELERQKESETLQDK